MIIAVILYIIIYFSCVYVYYNEHFAVHKIAN